MLRIASILAAVLLLVVGCGGDDGPSTSESYANDVCSNLSTWITDVEEEVRSLTDSGLATSREDIQNAFDQTKEATDTLVDDLQQLGPPDTEEGEQAKSELDDLGTQLREQVDRVQQALESNSGLLEIATTVTSALSAAVDAFRSTWERLRNLDPAGELRDAFQNSDDCKSLQEQVENLRSQ